MNTKPSRLRIVPVTLSQARAWIEQYHSHHHAPKRVMLSCGVAAGDRLCVVAVGEWPKGRGFNHRAILEVSRVASDGTEHAASKAIAAIARGAIALGYTRLVSYTLLGEAGTSYRAAGWWPTALVRGREWSCNTRPREGAVQPGTKARWEFGPEAEPRSEDVAAYVREMVGKVEIPKREDAEPLLRRMRGAA